MHHLKVLVDRIFVFDFGFGEDLVLADSTKDSDKNLLIVGKKLIFKLSFYGKKTSESRAYFSNDRSTGHESTNFSSFL